MAKENVNSEPRTAAHQGVGEKRENRPLPHPWLLSLETEKSQVSQTQTCQEQPFSLRGDRKLWPRALECRTWVPGGKCPPEIFGNRPPCEASALLRRAGSRRSAGRLPRHRPPLPGARIPPGPLEGCRHRGKGEDSSVFLWPPGQAARRRVSGGPDRKRVGPRQTAPEWPDKLLVPVAPPSELPPLP